MLCGEHPPSSGTAWLAQKSITSDVAEVRRLIGFCPQFDAVYPLMTAREHLRMYARLKGIAESDIQKVVEEQIVRMDLSDYADRTAGGYSGGNKRKLSVACALIGDPSIVFLDEPSTGMDPLARRYMWSIINDITNTGKTSIILTTHSMEECEALCSKIGIMVGGHFKCIGSSQRLKNRFGQGYQAEFKVLSSGMESLRPAESPAAQPTANEYITGLLEFLKLEFGDGFKLLEKQDEKVRVSLPRIRAGGQNLPIGEMFGIFERNKERLHIQDYSISQTSLEQIFNTFAKTQGDEMTGVHSSAVSPMAVVPT